MSIVKHQLSFAAGELSPWLDGRTDIEKYGSGCRLIENFIVLPQGGVQKRPGMEYLGQLPAGAKSGRLVEFQVSTSEAAMLVLGGGEMSIYQGREAVKDRATAHVRVEGTATFLTGTGTGQVQFPIAGDYDQTTPVNGKPAYQRTAGWTNGADSFTAGIYYHEDNGWRIEVKKNGISHISWFTVDPEDQPTPDLVLDWRREQYLFALDGLPKVAIRPGTATAALGIDIPWSDGELLGLRWKQINSVMYLVHPEHPPHKLTRYAADDWELEPVDIFSDPALLDTNVDKEHVITAIFPLSVAAWSTSHAGDYLVGERVTHAGTTWKCLRRHAPTAARAPGESTATYTQLIRNGRLYQQVTKALWERAFTDLSAPVSMEIELTASRDTWQQDHVDAVFEIARERAIEDYELRFTPSSTNLISAEIAIQGGWNFMTHGTWKGKFTIQRSEDKGATWQELRSWVAQSDLNVSAEGEEEGRVLLRIKWEKSDQATGDGLGDNTYAVLSSIEPVLRGRVKIKVVKDSRSATAEVLTPVDAGSSYRWAESAWNAVQGYPRAVELHQGRVVMAATRLKPHTVWGSAVDDYENFERGTDADEAFAHTLAIGEKDPILWLVSERFLLAGTGCGEWSMYGEDEEKAITPEFCVARRQSAYGAHDGGVPACFADNVCLFVQRGGTRIREFSFSFQDDRYEAANLNLLADHLFEEPVEDIAVMRMPWQVVWMVAGGKLFGITYERAQRVAAWHRHSTQGEIRSVATVRATSDEDEVWFLVERGGRIFIERFRPGQMARPDDDGWWMDAASGVLPPFDFSPLLYLHGKKVAGWYDGRAYPEATLGFDQWPFTTGLELSGLTYLISLPAGVEDPNGYYEVAGTRQERPWFRHAVLGDAYRIELAYFANPGVYRWVIQVAGQMTFHSQDFEWQAGLTELPITWVKVDLQVHGTPVIEMIGDAPADSPPPAIVVTGELVPDATGTLVEKADVNGRPSYGNYPEGFDPLDPEAEEIDYTRLHWSGSEWVLYCREGQVEGMWTSGSNTVSPKLAVNWVPEIGQGIPSTGPVLVTGLGYRAALQPMTPEIALGNGSSRSRELRIHRVVPSLRWSRGGKIGETPLGRLDPLDAGQGALFTGEIEKEFDGSHRTSGDVCVVSDEPYPFAVRSLGLKMNVYGDQ